MAIQIFFNMDRFLMKLKKDLTEPVELVQHHSPNALSDEFSLGSVEPTEPR